MTGESSFLDALSILALVGLLILVLIVALGVVMDQINKRRAIARVESGLDDLRVSASRIRELTSPYGTRGADVEMFLLAALLERGVIDKHRAIRLAGNFSPEESFAEEFGDAVIELSNKQSLIAPTGDKNSTLQILARARRSLGRAPVAALEYVLKRDWRDESFGTSSHILGYLQRCDLVDRRVGAAPRPANKRNDSAPN